MEDTTEHTDLQWPGEQRIRRAELASRLGCSREHTYRLKWLPEPERLGPGLIVWRWQDVLQALQRHVKGGAA